MGGSSDCPTENEQQKFFLKTFRSFGTTKTMYPPIAFIISPLLLRTKVEQ